MAAEIKSIVMRRGNKADLNVANLQPGEAVLCLDTNEVGIKTSGGDMIWSPMMIAKDDGTGNTHYEKYADGRVHEWGSFSENIAYTVPYGDISADNKYPFYFHSDTNDTAVQLPVPINLGNNYVPNVSIETSGLVWCANVVVQNVTSGDTTTSTLYCRTVSGTQQSSLSSTIHWSVWGFWK